MLKSACVLIRTLVSREVMISARRPSEWAMPFLFFVMVSSLFSMVFPYGYDRLSEIAPIILWVAAVLSTLWSLESVFSLDFREGFLEQLLLSHHRLPLLIFGKMLAHWLIMGLPLTLLAPVFAIPLRLPMEGVAGLMGTLALGMPILSLFGTLGIALTLGLHRGGLFLAILVLPLMMPVLLLGASGVYAAVQGLAWSGQMALLAALFILALCLVPWTAAAALRISINSG